MYSTSVFFFSIFYQLSVLFHATAELQIPKVLNKKLFSAKTPIS